MKARFSPFCFLPLVLPLGCVEIWPAVVTCEDVDMCGTTEATTGSGTPTTSEGVYTVTGDSVVGSEGSSSGGPDADSDAGSSGTTSEGAVEVPTIVDRAVLPDYTDVNASLDVSVTAEYVDGVRMKIDEGASVELTQVGPGAFAGAIAAFTGFDNGKHTAVFTPWRDQVTGATAEADYVIALPAPGYEVSWQDGKLDVEGYVTAIAVLPDGRPVEFGTYQEMGMSRCYLRLRDKKGKELEFVPVLPTAQCRAIDLVIDRDTGVMQVLLERKSGNGLVWWAGQSAAWGISPANIGTGETGDTAYALASRPGIVAVCGARAVGTGDKFDALAVLLRPDQMPDVRVFDYLPTPKIHAFGETVRDCVFAEETLVMVGEARGPHIDDLNKIRNRVMMIEQSLDADEPVWTVAGPGPGIQSGALAVDIDENGRYHLASYTCLDVCEREGEIRTYEPGGVLVEQVSLGPLGSAAFGPHAIAWSPAGYAVVALGAQQGPSLVFKVQAFAPGMVAPKWTFLPNDKQGLQMALTVATGPFGEVYAGGVGAGNHPAFAVIGG